ncbi:MAG: hypothetical protein N2379_04900 [Verrucomicrobiae bacterium]|nr:hypothetical protein [Verrucomicrobiae bacterium]
MLSLGLSGHVDWREPNNPAEKLLVCFALKQEAAAFARRAHAAGRVVVLVTGMGLTNAAKAARRAMSKGPYRAVFSCGFAAGLNPALAPGTVLFQTDHPQLEHALAKAGAVPGRFVLTQRLLVTAQDKQELFVRTGADAAQCESEAIKAACAERGIPFATVRVVLDTADEDLPYDFNRFLTKTYRFRYAKFFMAVALRPRKFHAIVELAQRCRQASRTLGDALLRAIAEL